MLRVKSMCVLWVVAAVCACGGGDGGNGGRAGSSGGSPAGQGGGGAGQNSEFDAGSDPARNDVMPGEICQRAAEINCAGEQACCDAPGRTYDACVTSVRNMCNGQAMLDTIAAANAVGFDTAAAKTSFEELEDRASMCDPAVTAWAVSATGFSSTFTGTLGSGADCEPTGGLQAPINELLIALASCRIGEGLVCLPGAAGWACAPRAAAGGRCFNDFNCADGLFCDNPDGEFDGMCIAARAAGGECDGPIQCASRICNDNTCAAAGDVQAAYCLN